MTSTETTNVKLNELRENVRQFSEYQALKAIILQGFPDHESQLPDLCKPCWHHLTILIVNGCRLVIPKAMGRQMLACLHISHQSIVCTKTAGTLNPLLARDKQ